jgi:hypothetical protein
MRQTLGVAVLMVLVSVLPAAAGFSDERADWGVAISVGADSGAPTLLLQNGTGFHFVVVDPDGTITGAGLGPMTFSDIRPGDRIDYAVTTWGGMDITEVVHVSPRRQAELND